MKMSLFLFSNNRLNMFPHKIPFVCLHLPSKKNLPFHFCRIYFIYLFCMPYFPTICHMKSNIAFYTLLADFILTLCKFSLLSPICSLKAVSCATLFYIRQHFALYLPHSLYVFWRWGRWNLQIIPCNGRLEIQKWWVVSWHKIIEYLSKYSLGQRQCSLWKSKYHFLLLTPILYVGTSWSTNVGGQLRLFTCFWQWGGIFVTFFSFLLQSFALQSGFMDWWLLSIVIMLFYKRYHFIPLLKRVKILTTCPLLHVFIL